MLHPDIIGSVQTLLPNRQQFLLHDLLDLGEGQKCELFVLFGEAEAHLRLVLKLQVEDGDFASDVAEKHVEVNCNEVVRVFGQKGLGVVLDRLGKLHEVLADDTDSPFFAFSFAFNNQPEHLVARRLQQIFELASSQLLQQDLERANHFFHLHFFIRS